MSERRKPSRRGLLSGASASSALRILAIALEQATDIAPALITAGPEAANFQSISVMSTTPISSIICRLKT